jgi:superfamily I DNA and/or RNA helicase
VHDDRDIQETIYRLKTQTTNDRLQRAFLVGATCLATHYSLVSQINDTTRQQSTSKPKATTPNISFPLVILDECSQMTEPLSLLPLASFGCRRAVLVGDPLQLPPTLSPISRSADGSGLERTLFERLSDCGIRPIMLKRQYRVLAKSNTHKKVIHDVVSPPYRTSGQLFVLR